MATPIDDYNYNHIGTVGWLVVAASLAFVVWLAWPDVRENNIFKGPAIRYAPRKRDTSSSKYTPLQALSMSVILSIMGLVFFFTGHEKRLSSCLATFSFSFIAVLATYIYSFIEEDDFSTMRDFRFAAGVWLKTILTSAVFLFFLFNKLGAAYYSFWFYMFIVVIQQGTGAGVFATLIIATNYFSRKTWYISKKKKRVLLVVQPVLALTVFATSFLLHLGAASLMIWVIESATIAVMVHFHDMTHIVYSDESDHLAEVVEE